MWRVKEEEQDSGDRPKKGEDKQELTGQRTNINDRQKRQKRKIWEVGWKGEQGKRDKVFISYLSETYDIKSIFHSLV